MRTDKTRLTWTIKTPEDLGRAVAGLRSNRGLTQVELSRQSGIPREYLARLESGATVEMVERTLMLLRRLGAEVTVSTEADAPSDA